MTTYISMIRGINVSGQKLIKMTDLRQLYEDLGFEKVITFLSSSPIKEPDQANILRKKQPGEEIMFVSNAVYLYCPKLAHSASSIQQQ